MADDGSLARGAEVLVSGGAASYPTVAGLNASRAVACWDDDSSPALRCTVLSVDGMGLSAGGPSTVLSTAAMYVSVAAMGEETAVVCYVDDTNSDAGKCNVLTVLSNGTLDVGGATTFAPSSASHVAVGALNGT